MIKFIILLAILFVALFFGHTLIGVEGAIIINVADWYIEMSIISALVIIIFAFIAYLILAWLMKRIVRMFAGSHNWFGSYSKRQQERAFFKGLQAYLVGDLANAQKQLEKSFGGEFKGCNYMLAADIDARNNRGEHIDTLLAQAQVEQASTSMATLKHAQLTLDNAYDNAHNKPQALKSSANKCIELLDELDSNTKKSAIAVKLRLEALSLLKRWDEIKNCIGENKKVLGDEYILWAERATHGEFAAIASKQGANGLREKWQNLSRSAKKDIANQICYVQLLLDQGLSAEAETSLVEFAKKREHDAFYGLFKQLNHASPNLAIRFIESQIKQQPKEAKLYSVLAHLAFNSQDLSLAERAINKALELRRKEEDLLLLAAILEKQHAYEKANKLYRSMSAKTIHPASKTA
uniref:heme biosynthesis HemY N-terminal domain-containing protein n=1 Tax=Ningiella ruwaisensis TaxID=2364274 RepID=UPI0010A09578|nr:heme biosynthesis HemY N-terminal domain-containing protein [Ningiella ruwaisensis]